MSIWITAKEAAKLLGVHPLTVRRRFFGHRFGRSVRYRLDEVLGVNRITLMAMVDRDEPVKATLKATYDAEAVIEHLTPGDDRADPVMVGLLVSTIIRCRIEHPDWPVIGDGVVFPPVLDFLRQNLPQGGGEKGEELRALILGDLQRT